MYRAAAALRLEMERWTGHALPPALHGGAGHDLVCDSLIDDGVVNWTRGTWASAAAPKTTTNDSTSDGEELDLELRL